MRKVLAALAVIAAASASPLAHAAEGETSYVKGNIEVYGAAKVSVDMIKTGGSGTSDDTLYRVSTNASRLGFRGAENMEDGLKTVFQVELGVNYDGVGTSVVTSIPTTTANPRTTETNVITMRNTYAGLRHDALGTVLFGIHDTPYKTSTGKLDIFADKMGDYNTIIGSVNGTTNFDTRAKNTIQYSSPSWAGASVSISRSVTGSETDNSTATTNPGNASLTSAAIVYDAKPLFLSIAQESVKNGYTSWDSATKVTGSKIGAGAVFGGTKLGVVYEKLKDDKVGSAVTRDAFVVLASQSFGKQTINLSYGSADDGDNPATKTGATSLALGLEHAFSKRTTAYLDYAKTTNEENATYAVGSGTGGSFTPLAGKDPSAFSLGITHSF